MKEEIYMRRCIQLAQNGRGNVSPNPMVGAVMVCDDKIIGEGYHIRSGSAHAEVNAIRSVQDKSLLKRSTLYVSLEPCSHYGKTPPCVDLIIENEIPCIVIGCQDPFLEVAGRGIRKLIDAGREVRVGVLEEECRRLNKAFITYHTQHRPYITLKWAESSDGYIDLVREEGTPFVLSTELTLMQVHKRRVETDAVMVGTQTARLDNPSLSVRHWQGKNPIRVVVDRELSLTASLHLFDGSVHTLVFTAQSPVSGDADDGGMDYITLNYKEDILPQIMETLYKKNIQSLLVEGGGKLLQSFISSGLWDEAFVEKSSHKLGSGVKTPEWDKKNGYSVELSFGVPVWHYMKALFK
ncbi:Riboflavin biosynthesis protein RibD [termite gut metagenome]|uniref:Riboflavin biosynthesis protein RibD n=1 Tax=termite gut metagenome TaxID=433724 RepID=A0A5J4QNQ5_9ZZZZ